MSSGRLFIANVLFFFLSLCSCGSVYYVDAENGNDSWNGLYAEYQQSSDGPWKTIAKVNNTTLSPGDTVLLKRGNIWREKLVLQSGTDTAYITYGAYGIGGKPQIRRSISANDTSQWINISGNIWELDEEFPTKKDVAFISFNNDSEIGVKVWNENDLDVQNEFWTDENNNNRTRIYSTANPASLYDNIEVVIHEEGIRGNAGTSYAIIENLHVCYCGWSGIELSDQTHHIIIRDCDVSYIGGGHSDHTNDPSRNGNGINTQVRAHDITVERCNISECYDAGVALQGYSTVGLEIYNINIHHNVISNCEYSFEFWGTETNSSLHDIIFENNTCLYAGYGWGHNQRPDVQRGTHIQNWGMLGQAANIIIRNNLFYEAQYALVYIRTIDSSKAGISFDHNLFYKTSGDVADYAWIWIDNTVQWTWHYYLLSQVSTWQYDTGWDANSLFTDPLLADVTSGNYRLTAASPGIDAGEATDNEWDVIGTRLYRDLGYDIGAYEFVDWRCTSNFFIDSFDNKELMDSDYTEDFWDYLQEATGKSAVTEENGLLRFHAYGEDATANLHALIRRSLNSDLDFFTDPVTIRIKGLNITTESMDSDDAYFWLLLPSETLDNYNCNDALRLEVKGDMSYSLAKKINTSSSAAYSVICSGTLQSFPVDVDLAIDNKRYLLNFIANNQIVSSSGDHGINPSDWNSNGSALYLQTKRTSVSGDMNITIDGINAVKQVVDNFDNGIVEDSDHEEDFWYKNSNTVNHSITESNGLITFENSGPNAEICMLRSPLMPDVNFYDSTVTVSVDGISMSGTAAPNKRRLFVSILSEENSSYSADDKFRVDIYGDGTVRLCIGTNGPGLPLVNSTVLPAVPHKLVFRIDKQHYDITFFYNNTSTTFSGEHGIAITDWGTSSSPITGDACLLIETKREDTSGQTSVVTIDQIAFSRDFK